ncbi:MAG: histidine triad nucleotide-binding protein [Clostridia bacterium]|nr:histidine triad nucleotide-binding protein [Clostridia bacterium]
MDCIFCKIINGDIPSNKVYEDEFCLAFYDIAPQAPVHVIVVPKIHIPSANDITAENSKYISHIFECIPSIAEELGMAQAGYRLINNCGRDGGQTVEHLHFHILGGRTLGEGLI